ncbi:MAG: thiamine pyrophosphate-binding protein [Acidobacteria bacterium]|nr:thiamine pyrophosphate-binding protein [Acidobacteriota bacterium]
MNHLTCAKTMIAQTLRAAGVRYVFGHPGGEIVEFIHSLSGEEIEFVLTGHESAAAFMAGAVGRLTGRAGVCLATLGPGACNLVLGVGSAFLDRDPLLAFSARSTAGRGSLSGKQNLPLNEIFAPVTKWSVALNGAQTEETICSALEVAEQAPRGPVYVSFPSDLEPDSETSHEAATVPPFERSGAEHDLGPICRALNSARWPIGIVGIALDPARDRERVRRFFADTRIPYAVLPQAKGLADEAGDGFLGTVGAGAGDGALVEHLLQSDCLLGVGLDPVESSQDWHFLRPVYSLANSPTGFGAYQPEAECIGDVGALLEQLRLEYRGVPAWLPAEVRELRQRTNSLLCPASEGSSAGLSPFHLVQLLRNTLPQETIVSVDVGAHKMLLTQVWRAPEPGTFLTSNGLSAMGYGVPAALAAALLNPKGLVAGLVGDGGFAMMVQELETARRLGLKPLFVVFCDRALAVIKIAQRARRIPHHGVDFAPVDWAKVAEGFGARGEAPDTLAAVERAVRRWLARPELTVLAVPVDPDLYVGLSY